MRATFRAKLMGIVGVAALGFVALITVATGIGARIEHELLLIRTHHVPRLELGPQLNTQFELVRRGLQDAVAAQDRAALAETRALRDEFLRQLSRAHADNPADVIELRSAFESYYDAALDVSRRLIEGESGEVLVETMSAMQTKQLTATDALRRATSVDQRELSAAFNAVSVAEQSGARIQLLSGLASFALVLALSLWLSRGLLRSVAALSTGFERFGRGQLSDAITVRTRDELGMLAERANEMAVSLLRLQDERERAAWIRTGQARLMNELQGDLTPGAMADRAISFLAGYLQLPAAAFHRVGADGRLRVLSRYAGHVPNTHESAEAGIQLGEGLVGAAAAQTELRLIEDIPPNYLRIRSGLGEALPSTLALLPLVHAGKVTGVLELACWKPWSPLHGELLHTVRESLAVAIEVANAGETQRELLAETQRQAQRLAAQEEQVRSANAELQAQQQGLHQANDELRQQAIALERKQRELEAKNGELDDARRGLQDKADQLSAISTYKSQFLANMSHELRTPLNSMLLLSNLLADNDKGNLTAKQIEFCRTIHGAGKDLLALINQVLDLAKIESGKQEVRIESLDTAELVRSAERLVGPLARDKGLELITEVAADAPATMSTDRHKLEQIVNNLLGNAVKFTEHGTVKLRIGRASADAQIERSDLAVADALAISVSDTGIGIAPEHREAVFAPFEQVDARPNRRYGGTGLGLTIARELSALLGGELQLQSTAGRGSTFVCYLPRIFAASGAVERNPMPLAATNAPPIVSSPMAGLLATDSAPVFAGALRANKHAAARANDNAARVLLVEDDTIQAGSLALQLTAAAFDVVAATTAEEALRALELQRFQCVVLDLGLPDMDGLKVLQVMQERGAVDSPSIVVYTGRPLDMAERQRIEAYADTIVRKVDDGPERLIEAVRELVHPDESDGSIERKLMPDPPLRLDGLEVLVVDDDMRTVYALSAMLRAKGAKVQVADTGRAALAELDAHADVEVVLMDIMMPEMDGYEAIRRIRADARFTQLPIIALTAKAMKGDSELCFVAGATDYMAKPIEPARLVSLLHSVMSVELKRGA